MVRVTGQHLVGLLEERRVDLYGTEESPPKGWESYPQVGMCYGPREGCMNEASSMYDDDTLAGVRDLFYEYVKIIRDKATEDYPIVRSEDRLVVVIEPSYEDTTAVVVYLDNRKRVVWHFHRKAWNFQWETPAEMAKEMAEDYKNLMAALAKVDAEGKEE